MTLPSNDLIPVEILLKNELHTIYIVINISTVGNHLSKGTTVPHMHRLVTHFIAWNIVLINRFNYSRK